MSTSLVLRSKKYNNNPITEFKKKSQNKRCLVIVPYQLLLLIPKIFPIKFVISMILNMNYHKWIHRVKNRRQPERVKVDRWSNVSRLISFLGFDVFYFLVQTKVRHRFQQSTMKISISKNKKLRVYISYLDFLFVMVRIVKNIDLKSLSFAFCQGILKQKRKKISKKKVLAEKSNRNWIQFSIY